MEPTDLVARLKEMGPPTVAQKLFGAFNGPGDRGTAGFFDGRGRRGHIGGLRAVLSGRLFADVERPGRTAPSVRRKPMADQ